MKSVNEMCSRVNCGLMVKRENWAAPSCRGTVDTGMVAGGVGRAIRVSVGRTIGVDVGLRVAAASGAVGWDGVSIGTTVAVGMGWSAAVVIGTAVSVARMRGTAMVVAETAARGVPWDADSISDGRVGVAPLRCADGR